VATPRLETERLVLRFPDPGEAGAALAYFERNKEKLAPTDAPWRTGFFTLEYWQDRLVADVEEFVMDRSCRFWVFLQEEPGRAVGVCNFSNFVRGRFQACMAGYSLDFELHGQGLMTEALGRAIEYAFARDGLGMHRVMANHLVDNHASARVLRKLGFTAEGTARDYLFVGGKWNDHVLNALVNPDPWDPEL
jgi:ribosomal-protein-alanine N-acetyltransferase